MDQHFCQPLLSGKGGGRGCLLEGGGRLFQILVNAGSAYSKGRLFKGGKGGGLVRGFTVRFFFPENDCVPALLGMATAYMYLK